MPRRIVLILPNIRSLFNVGSFFRTADAFNVSKIYLTGYTGTPDSLHGNKISKVALGAEKWIKWEHVKSAKIIVQKLKLERWPIVAPEQSKNSIDINKAKFKSKAALIVGNEVKGLPKSLLNVSDIIIEIPMHGKKESLNVAVAGGIALYQIRKK